MSDVVIVFAAVAVALWTGVWWLLRPEPVLRRDPAPRDATDPAEEDEDAAVLLFRQGVLEHASDAALSRFPIAIGAHDWRDLRDIFVTDYPDFPETPQFGSGRSAMVLQRSCSAGGSLEIRWHPDGATLSLRDAPVAETAASDHSELTRLQEINRHIPHPAWVVDGAGVLVWQNAAYEAVAARATTGDEAAAFQFPAPAEDQKNGRFKVQPAGNAVPEWFDVTRTPMTQGTLFHATPLTALIKAEEAQRDFVQTLAKTFAHLSIGLAIFNRDRQLALFNPALLDLTGLSASFLSPRPTIDSFFDALREKRRMPEPKNYKSWRQRMADIISDAETGRFEETWTLETGQTYSVKGRPHPDGAIAFLIEDISAEISITRNFRAELELGQSLVDTFEDALAVFSQAGILTFSNKAYDQLWGFQGDITFADVTIQDALKLWREKSGSCAHWAELQAAVAALRDRKTSSIPLTIKGQAPMLCRIVPIASGATVVRFSRQAVPTPVATPRLEYSGD